MSDNTGYDDILKRLEAGEIGADEAGRLLAEVRSASPASPVDSTSMGLVPDMDRFRRGWQTPFFGSAVLALLGGRYLLGTRDRSGFFTWIGRSTARLVFGLGLLGALVSYAGRRSPWAHIQVESRDGTRIELDLPVPLDWLSRLLNVARPWVSGIAAEQIDLAVETLESLQADLVDDQQPLTIDVNEDGDRVRVYFG